MDQFVEGKNPYVILGLERAKDSSVDEIKKAYRRLALIKHPDKAKTPNAAQEFDELKKAYAILTDKSARGALDEFLDAQAAREARLNKQDAKRQRMREELERKESQGAKAKNEEEQARARLKVELEALRARAVQEQQQRRAKQQVEKAAAAEAAAARAANSAGASTADADDETTQLLLRTVKVTWDPSIGSYTTQRLREIFSATWLVEDVILKDSKKKKKASALVVLSSPADAQEAAQEVHGDLKNPLLVVPYMKVMPGQEQQPEDGRLKQAAGSRSPSAAAVGNGAEPGARAPKQLLFASGLAGATSRPVQRPSKPLFPGAVQQPQHTEASGAAEPAKFSSFPSGPSRDATAQQSAAAGGSFSSFPSMPAGQQPPSSSIFCSFPAGPSAGTGGSNFSSFPSFPGAAGSSKVGGVPVGRGYEDSVLDKLQQRAAAGSQKQQ